MLTPKEKINIVLLAYKPFNGNIIADGVVGEEAICAIYTRRNTAYQPLHADEINRIILALKAGGYNDNLIADGTPGAELFRAEQAFIGFPID